MKKDLEREKRILNEKEKKARAKKTQSQLKKAQEREIKNNQKENENTKNDETRHSTISISLEREAAELSRKHDKVLYIFVDMKHIRAVEWISGKKRVCLNKERELRRTHKGGFSQEKFQRFVDHQKRDTDKWVQNHLSATGVLRGPYDKVLVETSDTALESIIRKCIEQ